VWLPASGKQVWALPICKGFTELLRSGDDPASRVAFLQERRAALVEQVARIGVALNVLDDKSPTRRR
jgi:hypothetical protein